MSRDYILRMIEQFGRFAVALRRLIVGGGAKPSEVENQLQSAASQAGVDLGLARVATVDTLMMLVAPGGDVDPARCWMCAELLYLDGLEAEMGGEGPRAEASYEKARVLFALVAPMGAFLVGFPEAQGRIEEIDRRLASLGDAQDGSSARSQRPRRRRVMRPA